MWVEKLDAGIVVNNQCLNTGHVPVGNPGTFATNTNGARMMAQL